MVPTSRRRDGGPACRRRSTVRPAARSVRPPAGTIWPWQIVALDHVQFTLPPGQEDEADRFYLGVLGFSTEEKPPVLAARGGRWYRSGPVRFHLGSDADFRPATRAHPAFVVADLDALVARLAEDGLGGRVGREHRRGRAAATCATRSATASS